MSKEYLSDRLREIAKDQGENDPKWAFFEALLGLSNGRISQIFEPHTVTTLGPKSLIKLNALGYRSEWVNSGTLPKRTADAPIGPVVKPFASGVRPKIKALIAIAEKINDDGISELTGFAKCLVATHPLAKQKTAKS